MIPEEDKLHITLSPQEAIDLYEWLQNSDIKYWEINGLATVHSLASNYYRGMKWWNHT